VEIYYENVDDLFLEGEIFKDINGYNGDYQVSNLGRIKSFKKWHGTDIRILSQNKDSHGYLRVKLFKNRKEKTIRTHHLLFETFNNYKLKKDEVVHHIDKNPLNNDLNNFQLMADSDHKSFHNSGENHYNAFGKNNPFYGKHHSDEIKELIRERMTGKYCGENNPFYGKNHSEKTKQLMKEKKIGKYFGENNPASKLTEQKVIAIRKLSDEGNLTQKEIAKMFGVSRSTISKIKLRKTWKHVQRRTI